MRGYFLWVLSLAGGVFLGGMALAQAPAQDSRPDEYPGNDLPFPSQPQPFSRFDLDKLWAVPGSNNAEDDSGKNGRDAANPATPPDATPHPPSGGTTQRSRSVQAEQLKKALAPKPTPEAARKEMVDALFERLQKASDSEDAQHIAEAIERLWLQSYSDTASLLMQRAMASMEAGQYPLALSLLDKLVVLQPDWAEAWNQRATTRFLTGDSDGAMADIDRVMKLEPRHFGALSGMGMILQQTGFDKAALEIFNKVLQLYPFEPDIRKLADKLTLELEGQDI
ncbi:MAG TPA: hypothetical protein VLZ74_00050 [Methylocella sp.]|nr:hypothetical protein [Methylocella sp.]